MVMLEQVSILHSSLLPCHLAAGQMLPTKKTWIWL